MDPDLEPIYIRVTEAERPEDVFGCEDIVLPVSALLEYLQTEYVGLRELLDVTRYKVPEDIDAAREGSEALEHWYVLARRRIESMTYGIGMFSEDAARKTARSFVLASHKYHLSANGVSDGVTSRFQAFLEDEGGMLGEVIVKIAESESMNPRMIREEKALRELHSVEVPQWRHLPYLLDTFEAGQRQGHVLRGMLGYSLTEVRQHPEHASGVEQKHVFWMLDRLLSALGFVHQMGVVHGNLSPAHIIVQPASHNVFIAEGWCNSVVAPAENKEAILEPSSVFSAPEVLQRGVLGPWSDIYSLGKLSIWLLGGDPVRDEIPSGVENALGDFILDMVQPDLRHRPTDAWELHQVGCEVKDSLWPRKFIHFNML